MAATNTPAIASQHSAAIVCMVVVVGGGGGGGVGTHSKSAPVVVESTDLQH